MAPERARLLVGIVTVAVAAAPLAGWILARSGRTGMAKFLLAWLLCYCALVLFGMTVAIVQSWIRPALGGDERRNFEDRAMTAIVAAGLFAVAALLVR